MAPKTKTKTKTAPKTARKPKTAAKPKTGKTAKTAKTTAKPKTAKTVKTRTVKLASGRKIVRPADYAVRAGTVRVDDHRLASAVASALACTDGNGDALNRAPIGSVQIGDVRTALRTGKLTTAGAVKLTGSGDWKTLTGYADATIGRTDLPDGMAATLKTLTGRKLKSGKTLADRKLTGRALAAAIVGIAVANGAKLPGGKSGVTAPVAAAVTANR